MPKGKSKPYFIFRYVSGKYRRAENAGLTSYTEVKFENSIKRTTAVANPRQIERVVRGAKFPMELIYEVSDEETMIKDFKILKDGFTLMQIDYLGGSGSRGYGRVKSQILIWIC